jgi:hypothetical protein
MDEPNDFLKIPLPARITNMEKTPPGFVETTTTTSNEKKPPQSNSARGGRNRKNLLSKLTPAARR